MGLHLHVNSQEQISKSLYLQKDLDFCYLFPSCWEINTGIDGSNFHGLHISQQKSASDKKVWVIKVMFFRGLAALCCNTESCKMICLFHWLCSGLNFPIHGLCLLEILNLYFGDFMFQPK